MLIDGRPVCKRCLLFEIDPDGLYKKVSDLIEVMPDDVKAPAGVYEERLGICRSCESLQNGICRECGCFVELRAAARKNRCPSAYKRWAAMEDREEKQ